MSALSERNRDTPSRSGQSSNGLRLQLEDIVANLEQLRGTQKAIESTMRHERQAHSDISRQINGLTEKREKLERSIGDKETKLDTLAKHIKESEASYMKLVESSQTLAAFVRKECAEFSATATDTPLTPSRIRTPYDTHE